MLLLAAGCGGGTDHTDPAAGSLAVPLPAEVGPRDVVEIRIASSDGRREILSFPASGSFGNWHRFSLDGASDRGSTDGWPSHIRDVAEIDGEDKPDLACGTNRGTIYYLAQTEDGLRQEKVFSTGCAVTAIAGHPAFDDAPAVAVGLDVSYVHLLDAAGTPRWSHDTGAPPTDMAFIEYVTISMARMPAAATRVCLADPER